MTLYDGHHPYVGVIVLTSSVCVCVCLLPLSPPNRLEFWHVGQVEEYLDHVCRSRLYVQGPGHEVKIISMGISMEYLLER